MISKKFRMSGVTPTHRVEFSVCMADGPWDGGISTHVVFDFHPNREEKKLGLRLAVEAFNKMYGLCETRVCTKLGLNWSSTVRIRKEKFPSNNFQLAPNERWRDSRQVVFAQVQPSLTLYAGLSKEDEAYWKKS